ncbi:MAG: transglutaminase family protein [Crocinitomicaceae bacterium]|nr:transglutaminase family protein [Crocinitomicaceae bacterium]
MEEEEDKQGNDRNFGYSILLLGAVSAVLTMPLFIFLYKFVPRIQFHVGDHMVKLDYILLFLSIFFLTYYLLKKFRVFVVIVVLSGIVVITITNFTNIYTLGDLKDDYYSFLFELSGDSFEENFVLEEGKFKKEMELRQAIDYTNPDLRNYAASIAIKHFEEKSHFSDNRKWVQFFSVFKEVNGKWKYVYDPANEDYYSKASETLKQLQYDDMFKGDCDDYSIMMAACIKAIGGEVRLVRTTVKQPNGKEIGHLYPEVKFGSTDDLETVVYLIKNIFFHKESAGKAINYFEDNKGFIWLNFDYNDDFPGGKYQSEIRESEIVI